MKAYVRPPIIPLLDPKSNMPPLCGAVYTQTNVTKADQIQRRAARCVSDDYSSYSSVTQLLNTLGWRALEQRHADARLTMFYKIVYGLVVIPMPSYIRHPVRTTRTMHPMHNVLTTASYYKYSFFPLAIVQWNKILTQVAISTDLNSFRSHVCTLHHSVP